MIFFTFLSLLVVSDCFPQPLDSSDLLAFNDPSIAADSFLLSNPGHLDESPSDWTVPDNNLYTNAQIPETFGPDANADLGLFGSDSSDGLIALNDDTTSEIGKLAFTDSNNFANLLSSTDFDPATGLQLAQSGGSSSSDNYWDDDVVGRSNPISAEEWAASIVYNSYSTQGNNWFPSFCSTWKLEHRDPDGYVSYFVAMYASEGVRGGILQGDIRRWEEFKGSNVPDPLCRRKNWYCCVDGARGTGCFNVLDKERNVDGRGRCD